MPSIKNFHCIELLLSIRKVKAIDPRQTFDLLLNQFTFYLIPPGLGAEESLYWVAYASQSSHIQHTATTTATAIDPVSGSGSGSVDNNPSMESRSKIPTSSQKAAEAVLGEVSCTDMKPFYYLPSLNLFTQQFIQIYITPFFLDDINIQTVRILCVLSLFNFKYFSLPFS